MGQNGHQQNQSHSSEQRGEEDEDEEGSSFDSCSKQDLTEVSLVGCLASSCCLHPRATSASQKMGNAQPLPQCQTSKLGSTCSSQAEGSFHRRMLTRAHQRHESLWTNKPVLRLAGRGEREYSLRRTQSCRERRSRSCFYCECFRSY
ncbi:NHS-like protein 1 isoform X2 [Tachysurus ichikawai]